MRRYLLLALLAAAPILGSAAGMQPGGSRNLELVGQLPLGPGFNADVWVHGNFAYVGTWGSGSNCPAVGVKIVDITDPASPRLAGRVAGHPNTTAEDMVVRHVENSSFRGDLLAVGLQSCSSSQPAQRGVELFDVTDPRNPRRLSFFDTGSESHGVHELDLLVRSDGRVFALLATIARFRMVEVTDPSNPRQISDWNLTERLGESTSSSKFCHSVAASADGAMAFLSYWDAGVILLDISDPANLRYLGRTRVPAGEEGKANSVSVSADKRVLITAAEDLNPGDSAGGYKDWGFLRVFDISDPAQPRQMGNFLTAGARTDKTSGPADSGNYTIRNPYLQGDLGYLSWYSEGVRVVDLINRQRPLEVGYYVPPDNVDPFGVYPSKAEVWGITVQPERNLIVATDINFGLYLMRPVEPKPAGGVMNAAFSGENQALAAGSIATVFGTNLAGATDVASGASLPLQLAGTAVRVNGVAAPMIYAAPGQINFLLPPDTPLGTAQVTVENLGRPSREIAVTVTDAAPGLFTISRNGTGYIAALHSSDQTPVATATAGEVIELYATGLGNLAGESTVTIGGRLAELVYAGAAAGYPGLYQLNVRVPSGVSGDLDVVIGAAGRFSNTGLLSVQ
jgi:uncharacterized protein (TIGR03437 family)